MLQAHVEEIYSATEQERDHTWRQLAAAHSEAFQGGVNELICYPFDIKELIKCIPPKKASGGDGLPSQILKSFTDPQILFLANVFQRIANSQAYFPPDRPDTWNSAAVTLLAKKPQALQLNDYRPISLVPQLQKLYSKWLYALFAPAADQMLPSAQHGFRRKRQCAEVHSIINKLREVGLEWRQPFVILKIDISKAFDKIHRSAVIAAIREVPASPRLKWAISRELINTSMRPCLFGTTSPHSVPTFRGVKQGAPESGLLYCLTVARVFRSLAKQWVRDSQGFKISRGPPHQYTAFADDTVLLAKTTPEAKRLYDDTVQGLQAVGLAVNAGKTQYLTNHPPVRCHCLPGQNKTGEGMLILGRIFDIGETTAEDMSRKEVSAWSQFRRIRHVLRQNTSLAHRFRILQSCVLQRILWGCESWVLTKKRLQHLRGLHTKMLRSMLPCPGAFEGLEVGEKILEHSRHVRSLLKRAGFLLLDL